MPTRANLTGWDRRIIIPAMRKLVPLVLALTVFIVGLIVIFEQSAATLQAERERRARLESQQ